MHQTLKTALKAREGDWIQVLPIIFGRQDNENSQGIWPERNCMRRSEKPAILKASSLSSCASSAESFSISDKNGKTGDVYQETNRLTAAKLCHSISSMR